jgi:hypothetical protein
MNQPTTLASMQTSAVAKSLQRPNFTVSMTNLDGFELAQRCAKLLATSTLVPKEYQGNISNCVIALNMAQRIGADPLQVMQNLVIVHGRPTWSSQFLIATVNTSGRFSALRFDFFGEQGQDTWGCRAWAIEKATNEKLVGADITIAIAKAEGWYGKNGSKWKTMPQQMLMYRAGSWWTRAFAPELSMGLQTTDEVGDVYNAQQDDSGNYTVSVESLKEAQSSPSVDVSTGEILDVDPETASETKTPNSGTDATESETAPNDSSELSFE